MDGESKTRVVKASDERVNGGDVWSSDVFVSHSSNQTEVARDMKDELTNRGFKVFIYEDDVPPGSSIPHAISNAIYKSRRCVMIISRDFLKSNYFVSEYRWAMDHQNSQRIISCLPVLYELQVDDLSAEFRNFSCLHYDDKEFYEKLEKAIRDDVPLHVPIETQITVTQTGVGLAWSYFYGYLDIILPGLEQRLKECTKFKFPVYPKMVIILPVSCRCPEVMPEEENFRHMGFIDCKVSRAANRERCYKSTVYDFTFTGSRNNKQVHCHLMMEFATPLLSLYQMNEGNIAELEKGHMKKERQTFKEVVNKILNMNNCRGKYLLIDYRDEDEQTTSHKWTKETLSQVVAREVENDMIASGCADDYLFPVESISTTAESNFKDCLD